MSVIGNPIIQQGGLVYYFDAGNLKCYRGDATTNTIPNPTINAYPTIGNGWGSYNTNQYGSGTYFSIGTVSGVSNNIVTMSANHSLRSYDVMQPQTSGGGVTAGTNYLIKKLSATTFSIHSYNSSQDGSQGYISSSTNTHKVYDDFANDVRVSINATNFPTMWWGAPHLPNSGLVKEIITSGYDVDPYAKTDCVRLHYIRDDDVKDGMSYNVDATVTPGVPNTHSCWAKAVTPAAVGKNVGVTIYNYGANPYQYYSYNITLGALGIWQRFTHTFTPVNANIISYWFGGGSGTYKWDLANIQVEAKGYATRFVAGTRGTTVATSGGAYDLSGNSNHGTLVGGPVYSTLGGGSLTFDGSDDYVDLGTNSSIVNITNNITVIAWIRTASPNSRMTIYGNGYGGTGMIFGTSANTPGGLEVYYPGIYVAYSTAGVLQANAWQQVCYTRSGTGLNTHAFYINGVAQTVTQTANGGDPWGNSGTNRYIGLRSGVMMNGNIATLGVYNRNLTASEVLQNFNATKGRFGL
jgi:hypothetical protein